MATMKQNQKFVKKTKAEQKLPAKLDKSGERVAGATAKIYAKSLDTKISDMYASRVAKQPSIYQDVAEGARRKYNISAKKNDYIGAGYALANADAANRAESKRKTIKKGGK